MFVDEAHLIKQWGQSFRVKFKELIRLRALTGFQVPWIAVTATATAEIQADIKDVLGLREPRVIKKAALRPEIYLDRQEFDRENWNCHLYFFISGAGSGHAEVSNRRQTCS